MGVEQYKDLFVSESEEHLQLINQALLGLEKDPHNNNILNEIFRSAHTLKGMSATMGFVSFTKLTHKMEDVLDIFRSQKIPVSSEIVDSLFYCLDTLQMLLEEIKTEKDLNLDIDSVVSKLESAIPVISPSDSAVVETVKELSLNEIEKANLAKIIKEEEILVYKIDISLAADCQLKSARAFMIFNSLDAVGEVVKTNPGVEDLEKNRFGLNFSILLLSKMAAEKIEKALKGIIEVSGVNVKIVNDVNELPDEDYAKPASKRPVSPAAVPGKKEEGPADLMQQFGLKKIQSIRVSTQRLDKLMNFVGELVIAKIRLMQIAQTFQIQPLHEVLTNIDRLTTDLQDEVMHARLIPMSHVFDRFPRMVRDLARDKHKQINLEVSGGEIELDRTVLDEIADPLVHLLRNSVDHGIELPQERKEKKKSVIGTIKLSAYRERTHVLIEVSDDGKGISTEMVRKKAVEKGFITEEEVLKLSEKEVLNIILLPGFSSAETVTDTSGRGVGMDVVKMKIESLGGTLSFESEVGKGSRFSLKLPLTVAIIRAMLVNVCNETYATPIANIAETVKVPIEKIHHIEKCEVINLRNEIFPLIRLQKALGNQYLSKSKTTATKEKDITIVVVESGGKKAGLVVDEVLGQQEVVVKSFGILLKAIKGFAGATILGDGHVALILDIGTLIGSN
ncbi:MAG: chemotaxis protein CheA [Candidatus Omnitrophica bacterium]|nr:chemotaxis protein CheA [Candidatus Omnitrophota bacterium]